MSDFDQMYDAATRQDPRQGVEMAYLADYENEQADPSQAAAVDQDNGPTNGAASDAQKGSHGDASSDTHDDAVAQGIQETSHRLQDDGSATYTGTSRSAGSGSTAEAGTGHGTEGTPAGVGSDGPIDHVDPVNHDARDASTPSLAAADVPPGSLTHTDQQEAIQATAQSATQTAAGAAGAVSSSSEPGSAAASQSTGQGAGQVPQGLLNRTGFALGGGAASPVVRKLPERLEAELRAELRRALAQDPAVTEAQAKRFSEGLSQGAVTVAFLAAHLDIDLSTDASTTLATALFRSQSPLLAAVLERLTRLEHTALQTAGDLTRIRQDVHGLDQRSEIIEHGIAWAVAERAENIVRGAATVKEVEFNHPSAIAMRDKARSEIKELRRREGRPIR